MNIFVLDTDIEKCAQYHCDKHVVKMIVEYAQLLSTAVRMTTEYDIGYRITHKNHPCAIWARESLENWLWLRYLSVKLNDEYRYRYDKEINHKSFDMICTLPIPNIPSCGLTPFPQAMPDYCRNESSIKAYRDYYMKEKSSIVTWKKRNVPQWYVPQLKQILNNDGFGA